MKKTHYDSLNEDVYTCRLDNGLEVHIIKKKGFNTKCAFFATRFGSFNTGDTLLNKEKTVLVGGLAHFLEHRLFDYKKGNVVDLYYKLGADANAFTTYDRTVYYFSTESNFDKCLELLLDFPTSFTMTKEAVEKEKEIIVSELLMYKDDPNDKLFKASMKSLYKKHPIILDVGGEVDEVRSTTYEMLKEVHKVFYNPSNMVLVVCGDVSVTKTLELIKKHKFKTSKVGYKRKVLKEDLKINSKEVVVHGDVNNTKLLVGYKLAPLDNLSSLDSMKIFLSMDLLNTLLFGKSSDFYNELIENKMVTSLDYDIIEYDGVFISLVEMDVLKDYKDLAKKVTERVAKAVAIIDEKRLESAKKKEIASLVKGSDAPTSLAKNYLNSLMDGTNYFLLLDILKNIKKEDLIYVYNKYYKNANFSSSVLTKN